MRDIFTIGFEVTLLAFAFALLAMFLTGYAGLI